MTGAIPFICKLALAAAQGVAGVRTRFSGQFLAASFPAVSFWNAGHGSFEVPRASQPFF